MPPLIVRLLLDAQSEFARAADAAPDPSPEQLGRGLNTPGWTVAYAASFLDTWLHVYAQGRDSEAGALGFSPGLAVSRRRETKPPRRHSRKSAARSTA